MPSPISASPSVEAILRALAPRLPTLITPALVLDFEAIEHNVAAMAEFAGADRWRPHIKTHKHPDVVRALLAAQVRAFKCATLDELAMLLHTANGAPIDVLVAYPLHPAGALAAARLAAAHANAHVRLLVDNPHHLAQLDAALEHGASRLTAMLDVDVGMHRTGTSREIWATADLAPAHLDLVGLHGYEGHLTWDDRDPAGHGYAQLCELASTVGFDVHWVVTSGTHAFHHALDFEPLGQGPWCHQVSPGTLVLSDLRSAPAAALLGLRQAAFVLSRVIARPTPDRVTLDAGSKALNPDCPPPGCAVVGHPSMQPLGASEEHRPCRVQDTAMQHGDVVALVPEHVCTTVNLYRVAQCVRGEQDLGESSVAASSRTHDTEAFAPA